MEKKKKKRAHIVVSQPVTARRDELGRKIKGNLVFRPDRNGSNLDKPAHEPVAKKKSNESKHDSIWAKIQAEAKSL